MARRGPDLHRLPSVAVILGIRLDAVKKLIVPGGGDPWLARARAGLCARLDGGAYVSLAEIEKFQLEYATMAMIARTVGIDNRTVQRLLEHRNIHPVYDTLWLGSRIYRRFDVAGFMVDFSGTGEPEEFSENPAVLDQKAADFAENGLLGESDDVVL